MTTSIRHTLARAGAAALLLVGGFIGSAHATGTAAGTDITNSATLSYKVNTITQGDICSSPSGNNTGTCTPTSFVVDNKVNLNVVTSSAVTVTPGSTTQTLTFTVSNTGNGTQDYVVSIAQRSNPDNVSISSVTYTDSFDPSNCSIKDGTGATLTGNRLSNVFKDTSRTVLVVCDIPTTKAGGAALANTDAALVTLKAVAYIANGGTIQTASAATTNDLTQIETIFADGAGSDDSATQGDFSARGAYAVQTSDLKVTKTVTTLCDPLGGAFVNTVYTPKSVPGAYMRYTITIANANTAGAVSATLTTLDDTLDLTKVLFDSEYITGANGAGSTPRCNLTTFTPAANAGVVTSPGAVAQVTLTGGTRPTSFPGGVQNLPATIYNAGTGKISIPWTTYLPANDSHALGELKPGETLTLTFNVIVN